MSNNAIVTEFDDEKDDNLKIKLNKVNEVSNCLLLSLTGYIDTSNSGFFQKRIQKAIDSGFVKLIFQCSGLNYISSIGIGSFTTFLKTVKQKGGDIVLLGIRPKVFEVFQLLGFSQFFNIKDSLEDSTQFFDSAQGRENLTAFPKIVSCPVCYKKLKTVKPGRFRCSECKSIIAIDDNGQVLLG